MTATIGPFHIRYLHSIPHHATDERNLKNVSGYFLVFQSLVLHVHFLKDLMASIKRHEGCRS